MTRDDIFTLIETELLNHEVEPDVASELADTLIERFIEEGIFNDTDMNDDDR